MPESLRTRLEREERQRVYEDTTNQLQTGVYCWYNKVNRKYYVGSASVSLRLRKNRHLYLLRSGEHVNRHLQAAWNKYGEGAFEWITLWRCSAEECVDWEQWWMDKLHAADRRYGYNSSPTAGSCLGVVHTDETREKMSISHAGKKKSAEHVAKVAAANRGRKVSAETKAKLSAIRKGKRLSAEHVAKIVAAKTGKNLSDDHKAKLSEAALRRSADAYRKGWETRRKNRKVIE